MTDDIEAWFAAAGPREGELRRVDALVMAAAPGIDRQLVPAGSVRMLGYGLMPYRPRSAKQTTGIASINMTQLRAFPLLVPPVGLQKEFAARIAAVEKLKATQRRSLAELDALFASLQHRAFRGEL